MTAYLSILVSALLLQNGSARLFASKTMATDQEIQQRDLVENNVEDDAQQLPLLPYEDMENTKFCRPPFNFRGTQCTTDLWCGGSRYTSCPDGMSCRSTNCHLHHILDMQTEAALLEEERRNRRTINDLDASDPIRFQSCGTSSEDAGAKCGQWCWGSESDCPPSEGCYPTSSCYNAAGA
mmetsp:Transcript_26908/g.45847  ORF Transcript_26908/g.45847 Transcript_26908/m.45847 type:complete len:180 (+) Transcript_26908:98-637(+)